MTAHDPGTDASVRRVIAGVSSELSQADIRSLLKQVPVPPVEATHRVLASLPAAASPKRARPRGRSWRWPLVGAGSLVGGLAFAAAGITVAGVAPWSVHPLDETLSAAAISQGGVHLAPEGQGQLLGTTKEPIVLWQQGRLDVQVTRGITVTTREGAAWIQAGAATVERDGRGTVVSAQSGDVQLTCEGEDAQVVAPGASRLCRPVSAAGMAGRVRMLDAAGASAVDLLTEVNLGLALPADSPIATMELQALRIFQLDRADRKSEALQAARQWLDAGHQPRRAAMQRLAGSLALTLEGCEQAAPHLRALASTDPDAQAVLSACEAALGTTYPFRPETK